MGDFQGHPFRGNQWTDSKSGGGTSAVVRRGDWHDDPLVGEKHGHHTPAAQRRLIDYLSRESGMEFIPHGSVSKGKTSSNDFDIAIKPVSEAEREAAWVESMRQESEIKDRAARGEITHEQAMKEIYGGPDDGDKLTSALEKIGFRKTREMEFTGNFVVRFHRPKTGHTLEIWMEGDPGDAESGPRMRSRDFDPNTGAVTRED